MLVIVPAYAYLRTNGYGMLLIKLVSAFAIHLFQ
jgi:hypothetical protein